MISSHFIFSRLPVKLVSWRSQCLCFFNIILTHHLQLNISCSSVLAGMGDAQKLVKQRGMAEYNTLDEFLAPRKQVELRYLRYSYSSR